MTIPEDAEFICVYGWDETLYEKALLDSRHFAFVSKKERVSFDPRIQIYHLESPLQIEPFAKKIGWSSVLKKIAVVLFEKEGGAEFQKILEQCHLAASFLLSESADWGVEVMQNGISNGAPFRRGLGLKGAFKDIPALIVGAGPSLKKNGHLLKEFKNKGLIFAGGSALNAIDIEPHFAASLDKEAPYRQFKMNPFAETPFCYQARMAPVNFSLLHGERLLFPDSFWKGINWIYGEEPFESGWTVGNFLTAIAIHMGCSPIVFVGMDFCYEGGQKYGGVDTQGGESLISVGEYLTKKDWLLAAEWMRGKGINATEGGMLSGPKIPLATLLEKWTTELDLKIRVHDAIQNLELHTCCKRWGEWEMSLKRCQKKIDEDEIVYQMLLLPLWEIWKPLIEREALGHDMKLHRHLFFQNILEAHGSLL